MDNTSERLIRLKARRQEARYILSELCDGQHRWTMSVPVQQDDSDIVLGDALNGLRDLFPIADAVEVLEGYYRGYGSIPADVPHGLRVALARLQEAWLAFEAGPQEQPAQAQQSGEGGERGGE